MKKIWGVRHIRYFVSAWLLYRHIMRCRAMGIGLFAQQSDVDYLEAVWRGEK